MPVSIGSSRLIARHSVDLPDPDGPITTTTSPLPMDRLMSFRTCRSPKCLLTPVSATSPVFTGAAFAEVTESFMA